MTGTVVTRVLAAQPEVGSSTVWTRIVDLIAPDARSEARRDLDAVAGIVCSCITDEALRDDGIVVFGNGPRVRIYCLYGDDAIAGDGVHDTPLGFVATDGDWGMSIPCLSEDFDWIRAQLSKRSSRIRARKVGEALGDETENHKDSTAANGGSFKVNLAAFGGSR